MAGEARPEEYTEIEEEEEKGYQLPEDANAGEYIMWPWRCMEGFFERFLRNFGWRFAVQMSVMYLLVKGLMMSVLGLIRLSFCKKSLGIDGTACQTMGTIASTPWAIKGAIGVLSDAYPLFGYHKASYIVVVGVAGTFAFLGLATLPIASASVAAMLMFLANLEIATADLLCEGKYAELMQTKPKTGSTMVSYVWGNFQVGALVAACFVGPVADAYDPKVLFWLLTPIAASIIIPTGLGYLSDEQVPADKQGFKTELITKYPHIIAFCLVMALCAIGNAIIDLVFFDEHVWQAVYALSAAVLLSIMAFLCLPRQLAMSNFYMFMASVLYINIGGAQVPLQHNMQSTLCSRLQQPLCSRQNRHALIEKSLSSLRCSTCMCRTCGPPPTKLMHECLVVVSLCVSHVCAGLLVHCRRQVRARRTGLRLHLLQHLHGRSGLLHGLDRDPHLPNLYERLDVPEPLLGHDDHAGSGVGY